MQLSEECDAILCANPIKYENGTAFAYGRNWAVNAPPPGGALRLIMVAIHPHFDF
jgi:hypothetical protein